MNATLKARALKNKYEADGWVFSILFRNGGYVIKCGKPANGSTIFDRVVHVYMHGNGKVGKTFGFHGNPATHWENNFPVNGPHSWTIEQYLRNTLCAYARKL